MRLILLYRICLQLCTSYETKPQLRTINIINKDPRKPLCEVFERFGDCHQIDPKSTTFYLWKGNDSSKLKLHDYSELNPSKTAAWYNMKDKDLLIVTSGKIVSDGRGGARITVPISDEAEKHVNSRWDEAGDSLIVFVNTVDSKELSLNVRPNLVLKEIFNLYAEKRGVPLSSLRFTFKGSPIFLTQKGKRYPYDIGLTSTNIDKVYASPVSEVFSVDTAKEEKVAAKFRNKKSKKGKGKGNKSKKKKAPTDHKNSYSTADEEEKLKRAHSKCLSLVFAEADSQFKDIRQKLNALNLERTPPKVRPTRAKAAEATVSSCDYLLPDNCLRGTDIKSHFAIQVGKVTNLYKTTKRSKAKVSAPTQITLDLRGLTSGAALLKLDDSLPDWIVLAMKSDYPFVIPVTIVCGVGNQVLSAVIEEWIRQNNEVANAPKMG